MISLPTRRSANPYRHDMPKAYLLSVAILLALAGCAAAPHGAGSDQDLPVMNRISWGANASTMQHLRAQGMASYLAQQLHPDVGAPLPPAIAAQITDMRISQSPLTQLVTDMEAQRKAADAITDDEQKKAAQQAYQQAMNQLGKEAATRALLRDLYSPKQLQEQMTWFWDNHFSVHLYKSNLRAMVADYEETAIRPHALGRFRDLLGATVHHPAMLRYLDNEQNAAGHINENYARELMELHTLGVDGGYSQKDVQELARVLTGLGVNLGPGKPNVKRELQDQYQRQGLVEFNPNRHDYGEKTLLGELINSHGPAEIEEALDRLCRQPATARFISRKLAAYFVGDTPSTALTERMAQTFLKTDGQIAEVLNTLFHAPEFTASLGNKFKDPQHYVVSAVRLAYDDKPILNAGPMLNWLNRMGEPPFGRQTPDGYAMNEAAWASPGQMTTRFEIAKAIGTGSAGLFRSEGPQAQDKPAFPQLANALYYQSIQSSLGAATRQALNQAVSPQEWNTFLLASPEFMYR